MRIGLNTLFLIPGKVGGTETYARGLISGLEEVDKKNSYYIYSNQENYSTFSPRGKNFSKQVARIKASIRPLRILYEQIFLPVQLFINKIDVLISLGYVCPLFVPCKSIVVIFDLNWFHHPEEFSFINKLFWKYLVTWSAKRADLIITSSENSRNDISEVLNISKEKISVVTGGIDKSRFRPLKNKKDIDEIKNKYSVGEKFILTVSAAYKFKNLVKLIEAYKLISKDALNAKLLIVGLGGRGKPEILGKIKSYKLQDKIIVAGWVPDEDIPKLYSAAELYVHPSLYEGFGFPVLEAMSCGCPVVSSNSASLPELVGKAGILVYAKKEQEIASAINKLLKSEQERKFLIRKGFERSNLYTWSNSALKTTGLVKNITNPNA